MEKFNKVKKIMARNISNEMIKNPYLPTKRKVSYWTNVINREVFNSELPKFHHIYITRDHNKFFGACEGYYENEKPVAYLYLTTKFQNVQQFISVLAHEMIHLHQWIHTEKMSHSKKAFFKPWSDKLALHGITLELLY